MQITDNSPAVPNLVDYSTSEDADMVSWSNHKLPEGQIAMVCALGILLLWLSAALVITDWAIFGGLPWLFGVILIATAWGSMLIPLHSLLRTAGRESIRVADDHIEFTFAGLCRPRKITVPRDELESVTLGDRVGVGKGQRQHMLTYIASMWTKRPPILLLAERMEHQQKTELHALLCAILAKRGWTTHTGINADLYQTSDETEATSLTMVG